MTELERQLYQALKTVMPWAAKAVVEHQNKTIGKRALTIGRNALERYEEQINAPDSSHEPEGIGESGPMKVYRANVLWEVVETQVVEFECDRPEDAEKMWGIYEWDVIKREELQSCFTKVISVEEVEKPMKYTVITKSWYAKDVWRVYDTFDDHHETKVLQTCIKSPHKNDNTYYVEIKQHKNKLKTFRDDNYIAGVDLVRFNDGTIAIA